MRRTVTILGLFVVVVALQAADVLAGSVAGDTYGSFSGPAFSATVVLNADDVTAGDVPNGTVAIKLTRGNTSSGVLFVSGYVVGFANGCDGTNGAAIVSGEGVVAKTDTRFLGVDWLTNDAKTALLAQFGITPDPLHPLVFSDINNAVCTQINGVWILSFTGTMQFGKKLQ
jgi:hypothetical protein